MHKFNVGLTICIFPLIIALSQCGIVVNKRSEFGQFCNETVKCNKNSWLVCQDGSCGCSSVAAMLYDFEKTKCVSKVGERCKFEIGDEIYEKSECVNNSFCGEEGTCVCDQKFVEISNGTCFPQVNFEESCSEDQGCRTDKFLKCLNKKCVCDSNVSENFNNELCVGLASNPCLNKRCTSNADCATNNICTCSVGYFQDKFGKCLAKKTFSDSCEHDDECQKENKFLECFDGNCSCNVNTSKFSVVRFLPPAITVTTEGNCGSGAVTSPGRIFSPNFPGNYVHNMACTWVITPNPNEEIELTFLSVNLENSCNYDFVTVNNDINQLIKVCDTTIPRPLVSIGNQLRVYMKSDGSTEYSGFVATYAARNVKYNTRMECVGLAKNACNPNKNCVQNAECNLSGKCECKTNFTITSNGLCGLSYGESCSQGHVCSDLFSCTNGKCACKHTYHQIYDTESKNCLGLISGPCTQNSDCINGASCVSPQALGPTFCQPNEGMVENSKGTVDIAYGSPCQYDKSAGVCDELAKLLCRNETCQCPDDSLVFDKNKRKCIGLVRSRCSNNGFHDFNCVQNASCVVSYEGLSVICLCDAGSEETRKRTCSEAEEFTVK